MKKKQILFPTIVLFILIFMWAGVAISAKAASVGEEDQSFIEEEMGWRSQRDAQMRSLTSWLTVAGLFWLYEGENNFGTASSNKIVLPSGSAPAFAGKFILKEGKIKVVPSEGTELKVEGKEIEERIIKGDDAGRPDVVELEELRMWIIKRGGRYAIRLRDLNASGYRNYKGLDFFPPDKKFKIEADFFSYSPEKIVSVTTVIGTKIEMVSPGYVKFVIDGKQYRLEAFKGDEKNTKLFFVFKDATNGEETYEKGRFMISDVLEDGKVDLNFNRAHNPPCAFTGYATCPVPPPKENWLKLCIEAGEKKYSGSHH